MPLSSLPTSFQRGISKANFTATSYQATSVEEGAAWIVIQEDPGTCMNIHRLPCKRFCVFQVPSTAFHGCTLLMVS